MPNPSGEGELWASEGDLLWRRIEQVRKIKPESVYDPLYMSLTYEEFRILHHPSL